MPEKPEQPKADEAVSPVTGAQAANVDLPTEEEQVNDEDLVTLSHEGQVGTFETTRGAFRDVWSNKGWKIATAEDIEAADKLAAEQA